MDPKNFIAKRIAALFHPGDIINLGTGLPDLVSNYVETGVWLMTDNGLLGAGEVAEPNYLRPNSFCNASGLEVLPVMGACTFDMATSFGMMRTGRVDASVLGCLEVASNGDLANWALPGHRHGMGGAMDIVNGVKSVIIATLHCAKDGSPKIVSECTLPLTGRGVVDAIVTEYAFFSIENGEMTLREIADTITLDELKKITGAPFTVADDLKPMVVA